MKSGPFAHAQTPRPPPAIRAAVSGTSTQRAGGGGSRHHGRRKLHGECGVFSARNVSAGTMTRKTDTRYPPILSLVSKPSSSRRRPPPTLSNGFSDLEPPATGD